MPKAKEAYSYRLSMKTIMLPEEIALDSCDLREAPACGHATIVKQAHAGISWRELRFWAQA